MNEYKDCGVAGILIAVISGFKGQSWQVIDGAASAEAIEKAFNKFGAGP